MIASTLDSGRVYYERIRHAAQIGLHRAHFQYVLRTVVAALPGMLATAVFLLWYGAAGAGIAMALALYVTERHVDERQRYLLIQGAHIEWSHVQLGRAIFQSLCLLAVFGIDQTTSLKTGIVGILAALTAGNLIAMRSQIHGRRLVRLLLRPGFLARLLRNGVVQAASFWPWWVAGCSAALQGHLDRITIAGWPQIGAAGYLVASVCLSMPIVVVSTVYLTPRRKQIARRELSMWFPLAGEFMAPYVVGVGMAGIALLFVLMALPAADRPTWAPLLAMGALQCTQAIVQVAREIAQYRARPLDMVLCDGVTFAASAGACFMAWTWGGSIAAAIWMLAALQLLRLFWLGLLPPMPVAGGGMALAPAVEHGVGSAIVAHRDFRKTKINGQTVSTLTDALVERGDVRLGTSFRIGPVEQPERIPSQELCCRPRLGLLLLSLCTWDRQDIDDWRFLYRTSRRVDPRTQTGWRSKHRMFMKTFWCVYCFATAKALAKQFEGIARQHTDLLVACYTNAISLALIRAFRRCGKEAVDVQHGLIGPSHWAYSNVSAWSVPSRLKPTSFLVWTEATKRFLEETLGAHAKVRGFNDLHYVGGAGDGASGAGSGAVRILVTLQYGALLPEELMQCIQAAPGLEWILRMHPRDLQTADERADCRRLSACPNVRIEAPTAPLVSSILACDLHITENSSTISECAIHGRHSIFWDDSVSGTFAPEVAQGMAEWCPVRELDARIRNWKTAMAATACS